MFGLCSQWNLFGGKAKIYFTELFDSTKNRDTGIKFLAAISGAFATFSPKLGFSEKTKESFESSEKFFKEARFAFKLLDICTIVGGLNKLWKTPYTISSLGKQYLYPAEGEKKQGAQLLTEAATEMGSFVSGVFYTINFGFSRPVMFIEDHFGSVGKTPKLITDRFLDFSILSLIGSIAKTGGNLRRTYLVRNDRWVEKEVKRPSVVKKSGIVEKEVKIPGVRAYVSLGLEGVERIGDLAACVMKRLNLPVSQAAYSLIGLGVASIGVARMCIMPEADAAAPDTEGDE